MVLVEDPNGDDGKTVAAVGATDAEIAVVQDVVVVPIVKGSLSCVPMAKMVLAPDGVSSVTILPDPVSIETTRNRPSLCSVDACKTACTRSSSSNNALVVVADVGVVVIPEGDDSSSLTLEKLAKMATGTHPLLSCRNV